MDHVLPMPDPDWSNPQPTDAPSLEETEALRHLQAGVAEARAWFIGAYTRGTTPEAWRGIGTLFTQLGRMCDNVARDKARTVGIEPSEG